MIKKIMVIIDDFGKQTSRDNIVAFAASTAFFFFLSIVPILMIICSIIPFTPLTEENLLTAVTRVTPDTMDPLMVSIISQVYDSNSNVLTVAIIITIWSAGKGMLALMRGLNVVNGVVENRNYFIIRLEACFYTVITIIALILSLGFSVFGKVVMNSIPGSMTPLRNIMLFVVHTRFLYVWIFLAFVFTMFFTFLPNKKLKMRYQFPGAVFASIGWSLFSYGFSIYVDHFKGMSSAYGSLNTIVLIMVWMYACIYILLIGANLNRYFKPVIKVFLKKKI